MGRSSYEALSAIVRKSPCHSFLTRTLPILQSFYPSSAEHQQEADDLKGGNPFAWSTEPSELFHQQTEQQLADEQQHDKEADTDFGDEPRIAIDGDGSADATVSMGTNSPIAKVIIRKIIRYFL